MATREKTGRDMVTRQDVLKTMGIGAAGLLLPNLAAASTASAATKSGATSRRSTRASTQVSLAYYQANAAWDKVFHKQVVEVFEKQNPNIKLNVTILPGTVDYFTKLQTEFAAGGGPDVTIANMDWTVPAASRGMFVNLKPYMQKDGINQQDYWYPFAREWGWNGGIYGVLLYAGGQATYVNKDLLKAAGLPFPKAGWTWNDLVTYGKKMTDPSKNQWGVTFDTINPPYWSAAFIQEAGGTVLNKALNKCTLTSPQARRGLQFIDDLIFKHKIMPSPSALTGQQNPFLTGKVGILFGGTWEETQIRTGKFNWDFAHMPLDPVTKKRSVQEGSNAWAMLSTSKNKDAAWEVLKFLVGPVGQRGIMSLGMPVLKSLVHSDAYLALHKPQHITVPVSDYSTSGHGYYVTPDASQWWNAVDQQLSPIWSGEKTVAQATQAASQAVDKIFARRKG